MDGCVGQARHTGFQLMILLKEIVVFLLGDDLQEQSHLHLVQERCCILPNLQSIDVDLGLLCSSFHPPRWSLSPLL